MGAQGMNNARLNSLTEAEKPLLEVLSESIRNPAFWGYSTWLDIIIRYRKSKFGLLWILVPPMMYILGMGYFFAKVQGMNPLVFMPHIGCGYMLFRLITMVMVESTSVLPMHSGYILDGKVRLTDFVLRVVFKAGFYFLTSLFVLGPVLVASPIFHPEGIPASLFGFLLLMLNMVWISGVISLFGARFPDAHEFMGNVFILGFLITPILWYPSTAPANTLHGIFMRMNPAYHMIELVRAPLLGQPITGHSMYLVIFAIFFGWGLWIWLYRRYARYVALWV
jgi:ABC-type polysaccharide/polyol phosphate export permease